MDTVTSLLSQWGSALGLGIFALWALWMLKGTMPKSGSPADCVVTRRRQLPPHFPERPSTGDAEKEKPPIEEEPMPTLNDRDLVQTMVRDNPEMAVAIIGKWLQAPD